MARINNKKERQEKNKVAHKNQKQKRNTPNLRNE